MQGPELLLGLGSAGRNGNFTAAFTVPSGWTLDGYAVGGPGQTKLYRSLDFKRLIPAAKVAAVRTAIAGQGVPKYVLTGGRAWPWSPNGQDFSRIRFFLAAPNRGTKTWDAAAVTALLAAVDLAITT